MKEPVRLSKTQMGIYVECVNAPESTMYNLPFLGMFCEEVEAERLKKAVESMLEAHPGLETILSLNEEGEVVQGIKKHSCQVKLFSVTDEEFANRRENLVRPFSILDESLCRFEIYVTPSATYFFEDIHHILVDGTSHPIIARDIKRAYDGETLEADEYTGIDLALEEVGLEQTEEYRLAKEFYCEMLEGRDCDCLPVRDVFEDIPKQGWLQYEFALEEEKFRAFKKAAGVSTTAYFTTVMGFLTGKYNYKEDSVISTVYSARSREQADILAFMVKTLPFVTDFNGNPTIKEVVRASADRLTQSRNHISYSFEELAGEYGVTADINFAYQGRLLEYQLIAGFDMKVERLYDEKHVENTSLLFEVSDLGKGHFGIHAGYRADKFSKEFVMNLLHAYAKAANEFLYKEYMDDVELTDEAAWQQIATFNQTEYEYNREKTVIEQFREQVKRYPDNTALVYLDKTFSYAELDRISDILAKNLKKRGVGPEKVAAVLIPRCEYMVICALGILKAGGAYMPLDPSYPKERLNLMVEDSGSIVLISTPELSPIIEERFSGDRIMTDEIMQMEDCDEELPLPNTEDLFIMLYTSGSTGLPKGVMLVHRNLMAFCDWARRYYEIDETTRSAAYASYGFDANMFDTYPVLTAGGTLYIIDESIRLDLLSLQNYYNENEITHSLITTQVGRQFALMEGTTTLRHLTVGGEKLVPLDPPSYSMYNAYGPTECTILITVSQVDKKYKDVPIGPALDNVKLYVVDKNGKLLPQGAAGELWAAGPQVARSYLNRPEQTEKAFTKNPFCEDADYQTVYHTGDVVRFMNDGAVQFIGRRDAQVKVRGFRIELTEVEEIIRKFEGIKDATVAAFDDPAGGKFLAAYIVSDETISVSELNDFIMSEKPPYMVPAVTMQIDEIPMNQNQKVNKRALPVPERHFEDVVAPQNESQQKIFDIIAEVIGTTAFGIHTNIFLAGLTSVGAVRLNVLLSKAFDKAVSIKDLKEYDTVERLEKFFMEEVQEEIFDVQEDYAITKNQEGIFVESIAHPDSTIYNIPLLLELSEKVEIEKLKKALVVAVNAHPYIKTELFMNENGDIRQRRMDDASFTEDDIEVISPKKDEDWKKGLVKPFELMNRRLFRMKLILGERNYLFIEMHHIISDGTSALILCDDISSVYAGKEIEKESYSAYEASLAEERARVGEDYEKAKQYYTGIFDGCDADCLPAGDLKEQEKAGSADLTTYSDLVAASDIKHYCESNHLSMNGFFTAAFGFVLSMFTGKEDSIFATIYNGRNDSRVSRSMAMFVKTFPVRCDVSADNGKKSIVSYVSEIGEQLMKSMTNDIYSFAEISNAFHINADVMFAYQGEDFEFSEFCGQPSRLVPLSLDQVKAPFNINVYVEGDNIRYFCEYRSDRFSRNYIECFLDAFDMAVSEFISKQKILDVSVCSDKAKKILEDYNDTSGVVESLTAPQLLERQVEAHPDKIAVMADKEQITFRELNARANKIAHALIRLGVVSEDIVGLYMERTVDVYAVRQGILKSGGAFLSTEPSYPDDRISYILENAKAKFVLTTKELYESRKELFDKQQAEVLLIEDIYAKESGDNPGIVIDKASLAYCIYTSGSTGTPKGVMIEHRNLMNMLQYHDNNILAKDYVDNSSTFLGLAAITFDVSIIEEMMPLYHGKSVAIATEAEIHNPILLANMMLETGVDMMKCTPSYMQTMLDFPECHRALKQLRAIIIGAEPFPAVLYTKMRAAGFEGIIFNSYGPTETTVTVTIDELDGENVTIGTPAGNTKIYMLDRFNHILPPFARGELVILGESVGRGYVGLSEATKEKFISYQGERAYRSGDIAYWNGNGKIVHCGRSDNQIKLRGLRVELDEIENTINRFEGMKRSVVIVKGEGNDQMLCAYYVSETPVDTAKLAEFLGKTLTNYMIPSVFVHLEKLPMTNNGKVDKKALPEPVMERQEKSGRLPANDWEKKFCEIFAMALGMEHIYADDDFFQLGGTSLSASKIAMRCMTEKIDVVYSDVFDYSTPEKMAAFVAGKSGTVQTQTTVSDVASNAKEELYDVLQYNTAEYVEEIVSGDLGNVVVSGATGYLGIHVVEELLKSGCETIYCLGRKGKQASLEERMKVMFMYYFGVTFEEEMGTRLICIDGDITDENLKQVLDNYAYDTIINCAACVKHFVKDDILDRVNVQGVQNLIDICMEQKRKLIQVSTVSVAGESVNNHIPTSVKLAENVLNMGQVLDNKYAETKFRGEQAVLRAVQKGLRGKVIRVGNLMSRERDGEFQINYSTNGFMKRLRAYHIIGKFPISSMDGIAEFSPIDCTAKAVIALAKTPDKFTVFHAYNCHHVHMANVIEVMNRQGMKIDFVKDEEFQTQFRELLADESRNMEISSLIAYINGGDWNRRYVDWDNSFSVKALYRLGFAWPLTDEIYITKAIKALATLGFFGDTDE